MNCTRSDREIVQPLLARVGDQASVVAELVLGPAAATGEDAMNEALRHEIVQRHQSGHVAASHRRGAGHLAGAVYRALARVQAQRDGQAAPSPEPRRRGSIIDEYEPILKELLARYPNLTVERALQELRARGFHRRLHGRAPARAAAAAAPRAGARAAL